MASHMWDLAKKWGVKSHACVPLNDVAPYKCSWTPGSQINLPLWHFVLPFIHPCHYALYNTHVRCNVTGMYQFRDIVFLVRLILGARSPRRFVRGHIVLGRPITPPSKSFSLNLEFIQLIYIDTYLISSQLWDQRVSFSSDDYYKSGAADDKRLVSTGRNPVRTLTVHRCALSAPALCAKKARHDTVTPPCKIQWRDLFTMNLLSKGLWFTKKYKSQRWLPMRSW